MSSTELVEDLFRKEYAHLVSALTRVLGPSNIPLAEDVVHDALVSAMHAWRFGLPQDPKAWIIRAAHNRAIDIIRREQRHRSLLPELATTAALTDTIEAALAPSADGANQLAMMFAACDPGITRETQVTLILRWLCGLSSKEIGQAFLVGTPTIDRRLHGGRARLRPARRAPRRGPPARQPSGRSRRASRCASTCSPVRAHLPDGGRPVARGRRRHPAPGRVGSPQAGSVRKEEPCAS